MLSGTEEIEHTLFQIDMATGKATQVGVLIGHSDGMRIACSPGGRLYGASINMRNGIPKVFEIDRETVRSLIDFQHPV